MSLAQELVDGGVFSNWLITDRINEALRNHDVAEIAQFIRSSENFDEFFLVSPPVNEELGQRTFEAIVSNAHIRGLRLLNGSCAICDVVAWIGSRNTLVNMTSLESVWVYARDGMSVLDCSALFPLLLTSTSLRKFEICFGRDNGCSDDVMSALVSYLGTASLGEFEFHSDRLSEAAFAALCEGITLSTVRQFTLYLFQELNLETVAESLARMILESLLEEVSIELRVSTWSDSWISALKLTAPVQNLDFAFTQIGDDTTRLRIKINRKWKPFVIGTNTPLALWPRILEKSHASPETSHASADIVFYVLRQKPELVPAP